MEGERKTVAITDCFERQWRDLAAKRCVRSSQARTKRYNARYDSRSSGSSDVGGREGGSG